MSRDWFALTRKPLLTKHRDPLADPLDSGDWQGLEWALPLLIRMSGGNRKAPADDALPHPHARIQTRSPFLIR